MSTLFAWPDDATIAAFLLRVQTACRMGRVQVKRAAREDAEDIGYDFNGIILELQALEVEDFEKLVPSTTRPEDLVWVFCPETPLLDLWIRMIEREDLIVVSFHEK